jgi:hypothetical protein
VLAGSPIAMKNQGDDQLEIRKARAARRATRRPRYRQDQKGHPVTALEQLLDPGRRLSLEDRRALADRVRRAHFRELSAKAAKARSSAAAARRAANVAKADQTHDQP